MKYITNCITYLIVFTWVYALNGANHPCVKKHQSAKEINTRLNLYHLVNSNGF